jgi:hypothetical protein
MNFLMDHAHREVAYTKEDVAEKKPKGGEELELGASAPKETISSLFGLSRNAQTGALQSIAQQLALWERAMTGFEDRPSTLLKFDQQETVERWKRYATRLKI